MPHCGISILFIKNTIFYIENRTYPKGIGADLRIIFCFSHRFYDMGSAALMSEANGR